MRHSGKKAGGVANAPRPLAQRAQAKNIDAKLSARKDNSGNVVLLASATHVAKVK